ncbi:MAG: NosD domain-containing protein [Halobacteriota archaeon]
MNKGYGILIISVTILVLCLVVTAAATNWSVDGSGGADFTGIQDAINNASAGDTILVHSGVYYENVVVDKSVTLKGIDQPVVDANCSGSAITLTEDGVTLVGFTATNSGSSWSDVGIKVTSNNNTITGNNVSSNGFGIYLSSSSNNSITGNNVNNNRGGISLSSSSNNTITGNNVRNNNEEGISLYYSSNNNTITDNNICNNGGRGISLSYSSNNTITGNNVSNNGGRGISLYYSSNNNTLTDNVFVFDGLSVYSSYKNTVEDNTVNGKPLVYLEDVSDYKVEDAGQVILVNCTNITVENLDLSNTCSGIALWKTENSKISNNTVCNNNWGGIRLYYSGNNTITGNNVSSNDWGSIHLHYSSNNKIYFNNFINNIDMGYSIYDSTTIWNSPLEISYTYDGTTYKSYLGNYWDDYEGTDADGDGIGDTHYSIDSEKDESDDYPLMKPFENYILPTSAPA